MPIHLAQAAAMLAAAAITVLSLTPLRFPHHVAVHSSTASRAALTCKMGKNKQQELAELMARAKAQREGTAPPEPLKPIQKSAKPAPQRPKKAPPAPKAATTREQLFEMMQTAQAQKVRRPAPRTASAKAFGPTNRPHLFRWRAPPSNSCSGTGRSGNRLGR